MTDSTRTGQEIKRFAIEDYIAIFRYRKWLFIIPVLTLTIATGIGSHFLTDIYRAQTSILVTPSDVPDEFVTSLVTTSIQDRITTIREQILSESLLLEVVSSHGLYAEMANRPTEELIARMRSNVNIHVVQGRSAFQISFTGTDPMVVQSVTNRLAQKFIDEIIGDRMKAAKETTQFLTQQMEEVKVQLDEQEELVAHFKRRHVGLLPEQMENNQRSLDRLQAQRQSVSEQIAAAEDRKVLLETQMAQLQGTLMSSGDGQMVTLQEQLESLNAQLNQMLQTLTPEHPDVKALEAKIAKLRAQIGTQEVVGGRQYRVTPVNRGLFERLQQTTLMINSLQKQRRAAVSQIAGLNGRIAQSPAVEQELSALMRDFDKLRERYQDLQSKHMEAKQAADLEAQRKGRQFKIIDPARYPEKPYKPNRTRLVALAFIIGIFLGIMTISITEHMDHSFRDDEDVALFTGKAVLTTIPRFTLQQDENRRANLVKLGIGLVAAAGFFILLYVILRIGFGVDIVKLLPF